MTPDRWHYRDALHEIRRLLDNLGPIEEQIRMYQHIGESLQEASGAAILAEDMLRHFESTQEMLKLPQEVFATHDAIAAAIQSLPDVSRVLPPAIDYSFPSHLLEGLNRALRGARFIAELEVTGSGRTESSSDATLAQEVEEQLVQLVPASAIEDLRRVDFAPLVLLNQVCRDPELMRRIGARDFEGVVATLVEHLGFENVVLTPRSGDEGRDVLATTRVHGIAILCAFECKRYSPDRSVGPEIARALLGTIMHGTTRAAKGILVTTSFFSPAARRFILTEPALDGKDFDGVVGWLNEYGGSKGRSAS
jgi:hypothetical protein